MKPPPTRHDAGPLEDRPMPKSRSKPNNPPGYQPGDCLVIPLFDVLFAVAWVAWASKDGEILGHIYAPFLESEVTVEHLTQRAWSTPLLICRFSDLGVIRGEWRVVPIPDHAKRAWAIPDRFSTVFEAIRQAHVVTTVAGHPDHVLSRRSATVEEAQQLPSEDLFGYRAVEITVSMPDYPDWSVAPRSNKWRLQCLFLRE